MRSQLKLVRLSVGVVVAGVLSMAGLSQAATVVSNLNETVYGNAGFFVQSFGAQIDYQSFVAGANSTLNSATLSLDNNGGGSAVVQIQLLGDNAGSPGAQVADLGTLSLPAGANSNYTFNAPANTQLASGAQYWLAASVVNSGAAQWDVTQSTSETGDAGWSIGDNSLLSYLPQSFYPLMFSLDASPSTVPTPAAALGGVVLLAALALKRSRMC